MSLIGRSMRCTFVMIAVLAGAQFAFGIDYTTNFAAVMLCDGKNITLSFFNESHAQSRTIATDPVPTGAYTTCNTAIHFGMNAKVSLTFTRLMVWRQELTNQPNNSGWIVEKDGKERKLSWIKNSNNYIWINTTSVSCPYLYIQSTPTYASNHSSVLQFNSTITLETSGLFLQLDSVPPSQWCDFEMQLVASPLLADYCQNKGQMHCIKSHRCLNASAIWCDGNTDCDEGEDEETCGAGAGNFTSYVKTDSNSTNDLLLKIFLPAGILTIVVLAAAFATAYWCSKWRCQKQFRRKSNADEKHHYSYPVFGKETSPLNPEGSSDSHALTEVEIYSEPKDIVETLDSSGVYSLAVGL